MSKFALIGYPIAHSLSPELFKAAYPELNESYTLIENPTLRESMELFKKGLFRGINVTAPFKEDILKYCDKIEPAVKEIGASNLLIKEGRKVVAHNTDYLGVKAILKEIAIGAIKKVLIIGGGGAGKAAALAGKDSNLEIKISTRTLSKCSKFCKRNSIELYGLEDINHLISISDIIIYTIPILLKNIDTKILTTKIVIEANYKDPALKHFFNNNKECYLGGEIWLLEQAIPAFEIFTQIAPNKEAMKLLIKKLST